MGLEEKIIADYEALQKRLESFIYSKGLSKREVFTKAKFHKSTFDRKLRQSSFSIDEMKRLLKAIGKLADK